MKKVILCAVALVFGTMAYAQVGGAPSATTPVPNNSLDPAANSGLSIQNGDDNRVRVRQAGELNTVYTEQDNGALGGGNLARVRQTGNVNGNQANSGEANAAEVRQSGDDNQSTTRQEGDRNNAYTAQGQNDGGNSSANKARIRQGTGNQAEDNYAAIEQDGDGNQANTLQTYDNSEAYTIQDGDDNKSMIVQNGAPENSEGHEALNYQFGDNNESSIDQSGAGAGNTAQAQQVGNDNQAKQKQIATSSVATMGNVADIVQGNLIPVSPLNGSPLDLVNTALVDLSGTDPNILPFQSNPGTSDFGDAYQFQSGKLQEAEIFQVGGTSGSHNIAEQHQVSGWGNEAAMAQGHSGSGGNIYGMQYQAGDNNRAGLFQQGDGHKALQDQRGHNNDALSSQRGTDHQLNIHQRGNQNDAETAQAGLANTALIVQRNGQSYVGQQNIGDMGAGGGNQIDVLQLGPTGNFATDGIDCGFDPPTDLTMDYDIPSFQLDDVCPGC